MCNVTKFLDNAIWFDITKSYKALLLQYYVWK